MNRIAAVLVVLTLLASGAACGRKGGGGRSGSGRPDPEGFSLVSPEKGGSGVALRPVFHWKKSNHADSYGLQVSTKIDFSKLVINEWSLPGPSHSSIRELQSNTTYYWKVIADGKGGSTDSPVWSFTTLVLVPEGFSYLLPADDSPGVSTRPTFRWTSSRGAEQYRLEVSSTEDFASPIVDVPEIRGLSLRSPVSLTAGQKYFWRVTAMNDAGILTPPAWDFTAAALQAKAWGSNENGELGTGYWAQSKTPELLSGGLNDLLCISGGAGYSAAIKSDGSIWSWGSNQRGELGRIGESTRSPGKLEALKDAVSIATGEDHTLALLADGTVWSWGDNAYGQLGRGMALGVAQPTPQPGMVKGLSNIVMVACGEAHSLALRDDGTVWAWGHNPSGQLGNGQVMQDSTAPVQVLGLPGRALSISAGLIHSVALLEDGSVYTWGGNDDGQLGVLGKSKGEPVRVEGLSEVLLISAGGAHNLALLRDGTIQAWGNNAAGQLGNATVLGGGVPSPNPVIDEEKQTLSGVVAIAAGGSHSLALLGDGRVLAWGSNEYGQLGNGMTADFIVPNPFPRPVTGITNAVGVAAGMNHSLALVRPQ